MGDDPAPISLTELFDGLCGPWDTACFMVNTEAELIAANQAGMRLLGAGAAELPGKALTEFVANPPEVLHRYLSVCVQNRQQVPGVLARIGSDGTEIRYRCFGHRIDTRATPCPLVFLRCTPSHNLTDKFIALNEQLDKQHKIQNQLLLERDQLQVEIAERRRVEEELRASEEKYRTVADFTYDWEYWVDPEREFIYCSPACERITGYSASEFIGNPSLLETITHPEDRETFRSHLRAATTKAEEEEHESEFRIVHRSGEVRWVSHACRKVYGSDGTYLGRRGANRDITDRKRAEEARISLEKQLLHAQKLESLGVLAGGIAHDFNNILMAIIGNADLALVKVPPEAPVVEYLRNIESAATRAADLAKQMLAYSGKGKFFVEPLDINRLLQEMLHMLEVSISKKAVLRLNLGEALPTVEADATQLRQVVMNLVINASEAIGERSGVISITTGAVECEARYLQDIWQSAGLSPGNYLYLEVADTGCGMDKETISRIFDPFFTTKFTGRGLGLSAVIGIVRGHRGGIKVYSEPGKGTSFKILLPSSQVPAAPVEPRERGDQWQGEGTVLLVDDEEAVRGIGSQMLRELGFTPVTAKDGREALGIYRERPGIEFVILDLTMPHLDGEQCFRELRQIDHQAKVIISSGYNEQEILAKFAGKGLAGFIQKPYHLKSLREAIKKLRGE